MSEAESVSARKYDLLDRLIDFGSRVLDVAESLPSNRVGNHIAGQLVRSGTAPAANYSEAQSAESRSDFLHKIKIALKELRETAVWLTFIRRRTLVKPPQRLDAVAKECQELIAILVASVSTAERNRKAGPRGS
jgi:four helix bundle protein